MLLCLCKNCIYSRVVILYLSLLVSIQNYAKTVSIQEKLSVCIMSLCIQNDNYFKKVVQLYYSLWVGP